MSFTPCAVVPSRNHSQALPAVVDALRAAGLAVIVIDDGSDEPHAAAIAAVAGDGVVVHCRPVNGGKGAAMIDGFRLAAERGYSHAVQVDAEGQHDLAALPEMLRRAEAAPHALVSGAPRYDASMPLGRRIGRWITHLWVFIETLSFKISDSMCGFRVYPLAEVAALLVEERVGLGMDFDTEIMVRLFWRGVPPVMVPVAVTYPPGNTSNFRMLRDNWRITRMHTRLVFGMVRRSAGVPPASHWAHMAERGAVWGLRLTAAAYRLLGRHAALAVVAPAVLYFCLTGTGQRRASREFLGRVWRRQPGFGEVFRHFLDFAVRALDTLAAWSGRLPAGAVRLVTPTLPEAGALIVVSHHGNVELSRATMAPELRDRLTVLVHTRHAENFNRVLREFRPEAAARLVQVTELGPDTAVALQERVERGEWVAMAGDRVPVLSKGRVCRVPFLGREAAFSQGPWLLASLLGCPVWLLFCRRSGPESWELALEPFAERIVLPRGAREAALAEHCATYAARLERECRADPLQWYNFFDFWGDA
jgi:predicted LPLAT superfamily acyltransferase